MIVVVSVRFKDSGRTYYFDPAGMTLRRGEMVIVETVEGPELAKVVYEQFELADDANIGEIKPVLRRADQRDFEDPQAMPIKHDYDDIMARCREKIKSHGLPMRLVKAEYNFYGTRLTFYFTSDKRVDFRLLVRDLARTFRTRIELRQVGPRDEAKLLGGIGMCGKMLCCSTFLPDYAYVNVKMAKDQDIPLNPTKISGVCNRLLCCLSYEHQQYAELKADMPRRGAIVHTPDGVGEVVEVNVLQQVMIVRLTNSGMQESYSLRQIYDSGTFADETGEDLSGSASFFSESESDDLDLSELSNLDDHTSSPSRRPSRRPAARGSRANQPLPQSSPSTQGSSSEKPGEPSEKKPSRKSRRRSRSKKAKSGTAQTQQQQAPEQAAPSGDKDSSSSKSSSRRSRSRSKRKRQP